MSSGCALFWKHIFYQLKHGIAVWCLVEKIKKKIIYQMFILDMSNLTPNLLWCTCFVNVCQTPPHSSILLHYHLLKKQGILSSPRWKLPFPCEKRLTWNHCSFFDGERGAYSNVPFTDKPSWVIFNSKLFLPRWRAGVYEACLPVLTGLLLNPYC